MTAPLTLFVAGATGVVGQEFMRQADAAGVAAAPHVRPRTAAAGHLMARHPRAAVVDLANAAAAAAALAKHDVAVLLTGTMRHRFAQGDTYQSSDVGAVQQVVDAARAGGRTRRLVLLSSVGAGTPVGGYLQAKADAEAIVRKSGLSYAIFRPSTFVGGPHRAPRGMEAMLDLLATIGLRGLRERLRPIAVADLAAALLQAAAAGDVDSTVYEGAALWQAVAAATAPPPLTTPRR